MRKKILPFTIALCALMTSCAATAGNTQSTANRELSVESVESSEPTQTSESETSPEETETPESSADPSETAPSNAVAHERYIEAMKDEKRYLNQIKDNGKFEYKYAFYDIDQNGIDELIISGGYIKYTICTYENDEVVDFAWNKYGGDSLKIYPKEGIVSWSGGHSDNYYDEYLKVDGADAIEMASKSWHVTLTENSRTIDKCEYKVEGRKATEGEYQQFVSDLKKNDKEITAKKLKWYRKAKVETVSDKLARVIGEWKIIEPVGSGYIFSDSIPAEDFIGGTLTIQEDMAKFETPGKECDFMIQNPEYSIKWQSANDFFMELYANYESFEFEDPEKVRLIEIKNHNKPYDDIGARFWIRDDDHIVIFGPMYFLAERQK